MPLTPKQKAFLEFLTHFQQEQGYAPSQEEIAKHFGFRSLGTVQDYLVRLKAEGFLENTPHARRGLSVKEQGFLRRGDAAVGQKAIFPSNLKNRNFATKQGALDEKDRSLHQVSEDLLRRGDTAVGQKAIFLPLVGKVAAGKPIQAIQTQDEIEVPASFIKRGEYFALEVIGNSMIEDGILSGDFIIVKRQRTAEYGQMIVALVDEGATVKRFYPKEGSIELHPAHPEYRPIIVNPEQSFQIEGIVAGVIRKVG